MAVTITLKTLQQQTFKIRMEPDETVRAGARGRERPGAGVVGGREAGIQREGRRGRRGWALPSPSGPTSSDPPPIGPALPRRPGRCSRASPREFSGLAPVSAAGSASQPASCSGAVSAQEVPAGDDNDDDHDDNKWS